VLRFVAILQHVGDVPEVVRHEGVDDGAEEDDRRPEVERLHLHAVAQHVPEPLHVGIVVALEGAGERRRLAAVRRGGRGRRAEQRGAHDSDQGDDDE
jgi:hypothetical protein